MKLIYDVESKPSLKENIIFGFQQMIAIMAATLLVPLLISSFGLETDPSAALFGAGAGTLVYIFFTKGKSPVFLGSAFAFLGSYAASIGMNYGYAGVIIGVFFAGLVYVLVALIIKIIGSSWIHTLMPPIIIGPVVTIIGLSLSSTATNWIMGNGNNTIYTEGYNWIGIIIGLITFWTIVLVSCKGHKKIKFIPFIIGIAVGYILALIATLIGKSCNIAYLQIMDFAAFEKITNFNLTSIIDIPQFFIKKAISSKDYKNIDFSAIMNIIAIYVPVAVVCIAEHISDHQNLGNIINRDLITSPGLDKTLLGDGVGSIVGAAFGGCANTTYGESIGCIAISGNASVSTIKTAAIGCMLLSFFTPFVCVINTIPKCVMGGACIAMYGFIAVSGLQMLKNVDLTDSHNLYVISSILVCGIGGMYFGFGKNNITGGALLNITSLASALIVGIMTNILCSKKST